LFGGEIHSTINFALQRRYVERKGEHRRNSSSEIHSSGTPVMTHCRLPTDIARHATKPLPASAWIAILRELNVRKRHKDSWNGIDLPEDLAAVSLKQTSIYWYFQSLPRDNERKADP
jgi:hypothetical protein